MTFTRLTLGDPRLRGRPKGGPIAEPCSESVVTGEVITDGGFENQSTLFGYTGILPKFVSQSFGGPYVEINTGTQIDPPDKPPHFAPENTTSGQIANSSLSQANPRSGSWHVRQVCSNAAGVSVGYTQLAERWSCGPHDTGGGDQPWTARIAEGVLITASVWVTTPSLSHSFRFNFQLFEQDFSFHSNNLSPFFSWSATGTYERFEYSLVVPTTGSPAYWLSCRLAPNVSSDNVTFDMDDASVVIS